MNFGQQNLAAANSVRPDDPAGAWAKWFLLPLFTALLLSNWPSVVTGQVFKSPWSEQNRNRSNAQLPNNESQKPPAIPAASTIRGGTTPPAPAAGPTDSTPLAVKQIATRTLGFGIPFSISDPNNLYIEVQLYMSKDRGQSWQFYGRQNTAAKEFPFQASGEGEYWFALKTLDRNRQLLPPGPAQAELKVMVDTTQPEVDFRVQSDAAGRIVCRWRASDLNIDPRTLTLAYRPLAAVDDRDNQWISVPYRAVHEAQAGIFADQYAWYMESAANEVLVRMQISDSAGNQVTEERQIIAPRVTMKAGQLILSNPAQPVDGLSIESSANSLALPGPQPGPGLPQDSARFAALNQSNGHPTAPIAETNSPKTPWPPAPEQLANDQPQPKQPLPQQPATEQRISDQRVPVQSAGYGKPVDQQPAVQSAVHNHGGNSVTWESKSQHSNGTRQTVGSTWPQADGSPSTTPKMGSQFESSLAQVPPAASASIENNSQGLSRSEPAPADRNSTAQVGPWSAAPPGSGPMLPDRTAPSEQAATDNTDQLSKTTPPVQPISFPQQPQGEANAVGLPRKIEIINSLRFRLNYDLGGIHPEDVERVVLWATRDGGQSWKSLAEDADNTSPFPVQVDEAGTYGFRIVFHTRNGLSARTPGRGDDADVWISIDLNPPVAALTAAPYGRGDQTGHLVIQWQAVDEQLQHRPISLAYSTQPTGPWTTIVDRIDNSGSYAWKISAEVPDQVYLQLTAIDAAGNATLNQTNDPIDLSGLVPRGRITGVQPIK